MKKSLSVILVLIVVFCIIILLKNKTPEDAAVTPSPGDTTSQTTWKTFVSQDPILSFKYPETLGTTYMHPVEWPPKIVVTQEAFVCTPSGSEITEEGETSLVTEAGSTFCLTKQSEGAAGSIYTTYTYTRTPVEGVLETMTFTIQATQCANYDEPKKTECETERANFDITALVAKIFATVQAA